MSTIDYAPTRPLDLIARAEDQERARIAAQESEADDFGWLMQQRHGRRTVLRLIERSRVLRPTFDPTNPYQTAHNEGFRLYGTEVAKLVADRFPQLYALMMQEAASQ